LQQGVVLQCGKMKIRTSLRDVFSAGMHANAMNASVI
jgi:hypothetical protein